METSQQQKKIDLVQLRTTPYFLIALFSLAVMCVRIYMLPDWEWWFHALSFCTQTFFMTAVWLFIRWLNGKLESFIPFEKGPAQRMFIQIIIVLVVLSPLVYISVHCVKPYLPPFVTKQFIAILVMMFVVMITLFNFTFYAGYFFKNWQQSVLDKASLEVQTIELEKEKANLQYHQLRNQVNPHYLFNVLASLDGLIQTNPELASEFVRHMAKVYRYVLQHKENDVVPLSEELEFIGHYMHLLKARYGAALNILCNISDEAKEKGIVMVTLQMLIDNAIKHNTLHPATPLKILIWNTEDYLVVHNIKQLRANIETSNKRGLEQLKQLYGFLSGKTLIIDDGEDYFTIKIPLLEI